jgi:hypothetical protein
METPSITQQRCSGDIYADNKGNPFTETKRGEENECLTGKKGGVRDIYSLLSLSASAFGSHRINSRNNSGL